MVNSELPVRLINIQKCPSMDNQKHPAPFSKDNPEGKPKQLKKERARGHVWDQRPWPRRGEPGERLDTLFASVGSALSAWERMETNLCRLFRLLMLPRTAGRDPRQQQVSGRAYSAVRSFEGRAAVLLAASEAYFEQFPDKEVKDLINQVLGEAKCAAGRRNDIAHGMVQQFYPEKIVRSEFGMERLRTISTRYLNRYGKDLPLKLCLGPSLSMGDRMDYLDRPLYCYVCLDIIFYADQFRKLEICALKAFAKLYQSIETAPPPLRLLDGG